MNKEPIEKTIAKEVAKLNGRTFYVGGYVRDKVLNIDSKDIDLEVHNITVEQLKDILNKIGKVKTQGVNFGIFTLGGYDVDISMPRKEYNTGRGHRDFEVYVDPFVGYEKAASRRDFTMNALMEDVLTGEIIDSFDGVDDIKSGIIRHVNTESFKEDPLRVLRAAQFASRFNFEIAKETKDLCQEIDISTLSKERVEEETKKALVQGVKPSFYFETLREMDKLDFWYPELKKLIDLKQDPLYHPEGDVWTHTMNCLDEAVNYRDKVEDPYTFMMFVLFHDLGKITTTTYKDGRIHSYKHEIEGLPLVRTAIKRFTDNNKTKDYLNNMIPLHMRLNVMFYDKSSYKKTNTLFYEAKSAIELIYFSLIDKNTNDKREREEFFFERLDEYNRIMAKPYVKAQDLMDNGLQPDELFTPVLKYATKLRLADVEKDKALKQVLAYAKEIKEKKGN